MERVLLALCLPALCLSLDNGLKESENVEINPLDSLTINPGRFAAPLALRHVYSTCIILSCSHVLIHLNTGVTAGVIVFISAIIIVLAIVVYLPFPRMRRED